VIDDFLGVAGDVALADFDATAMGDDAFGMIVNMKGHVASAHALEATCYSGTGGATAVKRVVVPAGLTASTLATQCEVTPAGNLALRVDFGNTPDFDALTSGVIHVRIAYKTK